MFEQLKVKAKPIGEETSQDWVEGYLSPTNDGFEIIDKNLDKTQVSLSTVHQYAGEINEVPIWEGDILEQYADTDETGHDLYYYYRIIWDNFESRFVGVDIYTHEKFGFSDLDGSRVIGNITDILENIKKNMSYDQNSFRRADKNGYLYEGTFRFEGEDFSLYVQPKPICMDFKTKAAYDIFEKIAIFSPKKLRYIFKQEPSESQQQSQATSR